MTELQICLKILRDYGIEAEYRPARFTYGREDELLWIPTGPDAQIEIQWFDREDGVSLPGNFTITGRSYDRSHGLAGESPLGSVYEPDAVLALIKWVLTTIEPEDI